MLLDYETAKKTYGSHFLLQKALREGKIYKIEEGVYSTSASPSDLSIVAFKYPDYVVTMLSAFFYHGLTDEIPLRIDLATSNSANKLRDRRIIQHYAPDGFLKTGMTTMKRGETEFPIYDLERTLIELLRSKDKLPYDLYKEVLRNYRERLPQLDFQKIDDYLVGFPKANLIKKRIEQEVI